MLSGGTRKSIKVNPINFLQILFHVEGIVRHVKMIKVSINPKNF